MRQAFIVCRNPEESGEAEHLAGACLLARREALDAIGLFDESFYYYAEDLDLCYRLRKAGWRILYLADVRVTHYGSASFIQMSETQKRTIYFGSLLHYFKKHSSPAKYTLVRVTLGVGLLLNMFERALLALMRRCLTFEDARSKTRANLRLLRSVFAINHRSKDLK